MRLPCRLLLVPVAAATAVAGLAAGPAAANHSWGGYHWARTTSSFTLKLGDNVSSKWDSVLATTSTDWSKSAVLDTTIVPGSAGNLRRCNATAGMVQVCNSTYGNNGWLGVASIWANGTHITQGTVKLNDTYFNTAQYNTTAWRNLVSCQEVGHTFGLDHQDENFSNPNLGTCMDYTNDPSTNQHPNQHDYDELVTIYDHVDTTTTVSASTSPAAAAGADHSPADWGRAIHANSHGQPDMFETDLGAGQTLFTFVVWAE